MFKDKRFKQDKYITFFIFCQALIFFYLQFFSNNWPHSCFMFFSNSATTSMAFS